MLRRYRTSARTIRSLSPGHARWGLIPRFTRASHTIIGGGGAGTARSTAAIWRTVGVSSGPPLETELSARGLRHLLLPHDYYLRFIPTAPESGGTRGTTICERGFRILCGSGSGVKGRSAQAFFLDGLCGEEPCEAPSSPARSGIISVSAEERANTVTPASSLLLCSTPLI